MYMEKQYSSEPNSPMPLFNQFKVNNTGNSKDTLMGILASGSHHSARARHLFVEDIEPTIKKDNEVKSPYSAELKKNTDIQFSPVQKNDAWQNSFKETIEYS